MVKEEKYYYNEPNFKSADTVFSIIGLIILFGFGLWLTISEWPDYVLIAVVWLIILGSILLSRLTGYKYIWDPWMDMFVKFRKK